MSLSGDWHDDMERFALDPDTADRLLSGALGPEDAPHRYGEVASLLRRASGPTSGARFGEEAAVAKVVGAIRSNHPRPAPARRSGAHTRLKALTAGVAAAFTLTGTLAAVDALPAPAQEVAADALAVVGVHVPSPSGSPATGREKPADVHPGHPGTPTLTTAPPATSGTSIPPVTQRAGVSASTTSVSVSSQPGAGAGRTQGPTGPATNPQSGAPQSAPAPTAGDDHPSAAPAPAPTSSTPQRQASRRAPSSSSSPDDGTRAGPRRGGAGRTHGRTPQD